MTKRRNTVRWHESVSENGEGKGVEPASAAPAASGRALPWANSVKNVVEGFLGWKRWDARNEIALPTGKWRAHEYPGVYLFADFGRQEPPAVVSYEDKAIFYVGETGRTLGKRWYGYRDWIRDVWGKRPEQVWVAAFPTWIGDDDENTPEPLTRQFRRYSERRIIWEHTLNGNRLLNVR